VTVLADAPFFVGITAIPALPVHGVTPVTLRATVTSAGSIPASLEWQWDFTGDNTADLVVFGASPNQQMFTFGVAGATTIKVKVIDAATGRQAGGAVSITVQ
jgi:hypothetical protein